MSLNFPTAFWKTDAAPAVVEDFTISWTTSLAQSYGDNDPTLSEDYFFPIGNSYNLTNHNYPFKVYNVSQESYEDFYFSYTDDTWQGDPSYEPDGNGVSFTPYFGWYRDGGTDSENNTHNLSPDFHLSDPWIVNGFNRSNELHIFFESDLATAILKTGSDGLHNWDVPGADPYGVFNNFIQSGEATGTFNIGSTQVGKNLVIKVSGLGEDLEYLSAAQNYDTMSLYLDRPGVASDEFVCSGCAPMDNRNVLGLGDNFDMQQVKLYTGSNIFSAANADPANETAQDTSSSMSPVGWSQTGFGGTQEVHGVGSERGSPEDGLLGIYLVSGVPRANPTQRVNQLTRTNYVTSAGVGTFTATNLQLGQHKIKINTSSVDGTFNSGAFYGFYFTLVN